MLKVKRWSRPASIAFSLLFIAIMCFTLLPSPMQIGPLSFGGARVANATTYIQVAFNTNTTWTVPTGVTSVALLVVGGGGGSSGGASGVNYGSGGGGGQVVYYAAYDVTGYGGSVNIVIGTGGAGVLTGTPGTGTSSSFGTITATGGIGVINTSRTGGASGRTVEGVFTATAGGTGVADYEGGGGAGAGGNGATKNGGAGYDASAVFGSGVGESGKFGGGGASEGYLGGGGTHQGGGGASAAQGSAGTNNTGGGGGGSDGAHTGGAGGTGVVIIKYGIQSPTIVTLAASSIATNSVTLNGNITSLNDDGNVTKYGFVLSTTSIPGNPGDVAPSAQTTYTAGNWTWTGVQYAAGTIFTSNGNVTGLKPGTTYYARAAGYNTYGWVYGAEISFTTLLYEGTTPLDLQVVASSDDVEVYRSSGTWTISSLSAAAINAGYYTATYNSYGGGFRFQNVPIPKGAIITKSYLSFDCQTANNLAVVNSYITGDKPTNGSSTTFSTLADYQARRGTAVGGANNNLRTTAQVAWSSIGTWALNSWYNSPDISTIIQEQIDNANWTAYNSLALFWDDHGNESTHSDVRIRTSYSYDSGQSVAPRLHIEYTTPPVITTLTTDDLAATTATLNGNVTGLGTANRDGATLLKARFPAYRYVGAHDRTYFTWISHINNGSIWVSYFDQSTLAYGDPVQLASDMGTVDVHYSPVIEVIPSGTYAGYILVAWGNDTYLNLRRSSSTENISAWGSTQAIEATASYQQIVHLGNGSEAIFYVYVQAGTRIPCGYKTSDDGGQTWSATTKLIDFGDNMWIYPSVITQGNTTHIAFHYFTLGDMYRNVYYIYSDDNLGTWQTQGSGAHITLPVNAATAEKVYTVAKSWVSDIQLDGTGSPVIAFSVLSDATTGLALWARYSSGWLVYSTGVSTLIYKSGDLIAYNTGIFLDSYDTTHVYIGVKNAITGNTSDIQEWHTTDSGTTWAKVTDLTYNSKDMCGEAKPVVNYGTGIKLMYNMVLSWTAYDSWTSNIRLYPPVSGIPNEPLLNYGFVWDTSTHTSPGNSAPSTQVLYPGNYTSGTVSYSVGQLFDHGITGLTAGTLYYTRAAGNNVDGWYYGSESTFYASPENITNFTATPACWSIVLNWTVGAGGNTTVVRGSQAGYPALPTDGTLIGNVTGNTTTHNSLSPCSGAWYYSAWEWDTESNSYSATPAQISSATTNPGLPTVNTLVATLVEETTATLNGNVTVATCNVDGEGFVYGTSSHSPGNVTPSSSSYDLYWPNPFTTIGNITVGDYDTGISSLTKGELYYVRAIAHSCAGYTYGDEVTFLTKPDEPTALSITGTTATSVDLTWTKGTGAQKTMIRYSTSGYPTDYTGGDGSTQAYFDTGTGTTVTPLSSGQIYYFTAWSYATEGGLEQYSDANSQDSDYTLPADPSSLDAKNPGANSIDLEWAKGTGGDITIVRGKIGSYPSSPTDITSTLIYNSTGTTTTHSSLSCCTGWYYRAWAYDTDSTYYSSGYSQDIETTLCALPTATTSAADSIGNASVTLHGSAAAGSCSLTDTGFVWSATSVPVNPGNVTPASSGYSDNHMLSNTASPFDYGISSLAPGLRYYFRAVSQSSNGYGYGDEVVLLTSPGNPSGLNITGHTNNSISISFTKGTNANNTIIKYDTAGYPATYNDGTLGGNATGTTATISGLDPNQLYYIRIWSWTTAGGLEEYSSGYAQITGYTSPADITNFTSTAHDGISISLEWTMPTGGDQTKVLGKEGSYPSGPTDVTATVVYLGTGNSTTHSGLIDCMDWYYVAYGYGNVSTYYSDNAVQFNQGTTCVAPTVIADAATNVEETTATLNGNVTDVGSSNVKYYGFVWGTTTQVAPAGAPNTGLYDTNWTSTLGNWTAGAFTHNITTLTEGELYYSRFGAKNNSPNWSWGDETLLLTKPLETTGCSIVQGDTHLELSWTKPASADKTVIVRKEGSYPANRADGLEVYNDTGTYYDDVGLTNAHHYYYRMWSWATEGGLEQFSDAYCDTNGTPQPIPAITTNAASFVEETTAQLNGAITNDNGGVLEVGFDWGIATGVYTLHWTNVAAYGNDSFLRAIDSLSEGACVYYRAKARNATGWGYGSESIFQTKPDEPTGLADTAHTSASITLGWTNGDGADSVIIRYKTTGYPTDYSDGTLAYSGAGVSTIVALPITGQIYYFRIWSVSVCEGLTQYSDTYSQHTAYTSPSDPTGFDAHDPTSTSVLLDWTKGTNSDKTLIVAKLDGYPANTGDGTQVYWDTGISSVHSVPSCNNMFKHWYYRAWAYDSDSGYFSDSYSEDNETTLKDLPIVTNGVGVTDITNTSARLNGELTCDGGATTTVHIYWGDNNGGTTAVNWDNDANFGATSIGTFYIDLDTLSEGIIYYYRCYSTNSMGSDWADATISFLTVCLPPVGLTATYISTYQVDLTWTPGITGGKTVIQGMFNGAPDNANDGFPVYDGYGNSTHASINMNCVVGNITFRGWGLCTAQYSGNYTETHINVNNTCGGGGNYTGNYTATCDAVDCDPPTGLVATLLTPDTVSLTWTPGNATSVTVIKVQVGTPPANPYEGDLLYRGPGNSTVCSIPTDFVGDTLKFRAWTVCCPWIGY